MASLGAAISGCPILRWSTSIPFSFAFSEKTTSFRIGEVGSSIPFLDR